PERTPVGEEPRPTLRRREVDVLSRQGQDLARERHRSDDRLLEGLCAALANEAVGIVLGREEQEAEGARVDGMRQARLEGAAGGATAGGVAVEAEHDGVREADELLHVLRGARRA